MTFEWAGFIYLEFCPLDPPLGHVSLSILDN